MTRVLRARRQKSALLLTTACALARASAGRCQPPRTPPTAPQRATELNGKAWPELCAEDDEEAEEHFFVIGDWGGVGVPPRPANQASRRGRPFVVGVDDRAQQRVAAQMKARANRTHPRFVVNVGDNFYWGGIDTNCGQTGPLVRTGQWQHVFEAMYSGPDLAGKPWMGVLGNHDYGGWMFTAGWDQAVMYTWGPGERWLTPALYWSRRVAYRDFAADLFFVDTNVNDAHHPMAFPNTNMCSLAHNPAGASCGATGPSSVWSCHEWFQDLWAEQVPWLEAGLRSSTAEWQIVVTHFPPDFMIDFWSRLSETHGVDLIIAGHRHQEEVHYEDGFSGGMLGSTAWIVAGGGGGITSEGTPRLDGQDDMYGFMDVAISREELRIDAISHGGVLRSSTKVRPRLSLAERQRTTTAPQPTRPQTATATATSTAAAATSTASATSTVTTTSTAATTSTGASTSTAAGTTTATLPPPVLGAAAASPAARGSAPGLARRAPPPTPPLV